MCIFTLEKHALLKSGKMAGSEMPLLRIFTVFRKTSFIFKLTFTSIFLEVQKIDYYQYSVGKCFNYQLHENCIPKILIPKIRLLGVEGMTLAHFAYTISGSVSVTNEVLLWSDIYLRFIVFKYGCL